MELILTWVIKAEHTGVGGSGGGYLGDPSRAHRYFNKKHNFIWILYFYALAPGTQWVRTLTLYLLTYPKMPKSVRTTVVNLSQYRWKPDRSRQFGTGQIRARQVKWRWNRSSLIILWTHNLFGPKKSFDQKFFEYKFLFDSKWPVSIFFTNLAISWLTNHNTI